MLGGARSNIFVAFNSSAMWVSSLGSRMETLSGSGRLGPFLLLGSHGNIILTLMPSTPKHNDSLILCYKESSVNKCKKLTLAKEDVSDGAVDVDVGGLTTVNHQTINEFHALGTLAAEFARDNHFTALGTRLHDESENTIAGPVKNNRAIRNL